MSTLPSMSVSDSTASPFDGDSMFKCARSGIASVKLEVLASDLRAVILVRAILYILFFLKSVDFNFFALL